MSKCDFRHLEYLWAVDGPDWRLNLGSLAATGLADRLKTLNVQFAQQRMRAVSDKCDFRVTLSAAGTQRILNEPAVSAAVSSDKCDFAMALLGTRGKQQALSRVATRMRSDKCDFAVQLQFGPQRAPLVRISAVASAKCDFRLKQVEIREAGGDWRSVGGGGGGGGLGGGDKRNKD